MIHRLPFFSWKSNYILTSADDSVLDYLDYTPPPYQPDGKIHTWYIADTEFMQKDASNLVSKWVDKSNSARTHNAKQTKSSHQPLFVEKAIDKNQIKQMQFETNTILTSY